MEKALGGSLKNQVMAILKAAILSGELVSGITYTMAEIATMIGASRTPVREALMELETRGMVSITRSVGFRVIIPNNADIKDAHEIRVMLEVPAMGRLAGNLTPETIANAQALIQRMDGPIQRDDLVDYLRLDSEFHMLLIDQLGNRRLTALVADLRDSQRVPGLARLVRSGQLGQRNNEHRAILQALEGRPDQRSTVETLVEAHLALSRQAWDGTV